MTHSHPNQHTGCGEAKAFRSIAPTPQVNNPVVTVSFRRGGHHPGGSPRYLARRGSFIGSFHGSLHRIVEQRNNG